MFWTWNLTTLLFPCFSENKDSETTRPLSKSGFSSGSKITGISYAIGPWLILHKICEHRPRLIKHCFLFVRTVQKSESSLVSIISNRLFTLSRVKDGKTHASGGLVIPVFTHSSITLYPTSGNEMSSVVTENGTKVGSCSCFNLKVNSIRPFYGMGVPLAAVKSNSQSRSSEIFLNFALWKWRRRKCSRMIETWEPMSHNASIEIPSSLQLIVHLFPTSFAICDDCFGVKCVTKVKGFTFLSDILLKVWAALQITLWPYALCFFWHDLLQYWTRLHPLHFHTVKPFWEVPQKLQHWGLTTSPVTPHPPGITESCPRGITD